MQRPASRRPGSARLVPTQPRGASAVHTVASAFRDIIAGDNKSGTIGYEAATGWDPCTGLGSPSGTKLRAILGAATAESP